MDNDEDGDVLSHFQDIMIVDGFIHEINYNITQIIPSEINQLCFDYFFIESVEILKEKRNKAKQKKDIDKMLQIEQLIVHEISYSVFTMDQQHQSLYYQDLLREVLNHWISKKKVDKFRNEIVESTKRCIQNDNIRLFKILWKYCAYDKINYFDNVRNNEVIEFINTASKYASFDCISLLLKYPNKLNWRNGAIRYKPICLLNAVKYHHNNLKLINFIIDKLETLKLSFICDDIMNEVIRFDLVCIAKRLMDNHWHKITEEDELHAQLINDELGNSKCFELFNKKSNAFNYYNDNEEHQGINWNDDEWDNVENPNEDFDEDHDWENAQQFED